MKPLQNRILSHAPRLYFFFFTAFFGFIFSDLSSQTPAINELNAGWVNKYKTVKYNPVGTGLTTGHVVTLFIENTGDQTLEMEIDPTIIPPTEKYQGYIIPFSIEVTVPADSIISVPLEGYCTDIHRPAVPLNYSIIAVDEWVTEDMIDPVPEFPWQPVADDAFVPIEDVSTREIVATYPGTETVFPYTISVTDHPVSSAPLLFYGIQSIINSYEVMHENDEISTPFSSQPEKEQETVNQQTFWILTSALTGDEYKMEDFETKTIQQYEKITATDIETVPIAVKDDLSQGIAEFWYTFEAVGKDAKVFADQPPTKEDEDTTKPLEEGEETEAKKCKCKSMKFSLEVFLGSTQFKLFSEIDTVIKAKRYTFPEIGNSLDVEVTPTKFTTMKGDLLFVSVKSPELKCICNDEADTCTEIYGQRKDKDLVQDKDGKLHVPGVDFFKPGEYVVIPLTDERRGVRKKPSGVFSDEKWKADKKIIEKAQKWIPGKYQDDRYDLEIMETTKISDKNEYYFTVRVKGYCRDKNGACGGSDGGKSCYVDVKVNLPKVKKEK